MVMLISRLAIACLVLALTGCAEVAAPPTMPSSSPSSTPAGPPSLVKLVAGAQPKVESFPFSFGWIPANSTAMASIQEGPVLVCRYEDGWVEVRMHSSEPKLDIKGSSRTTTVGGAPARLSKADHLGNGNGLSTPLVQVVWKHQDSWVEVVGGLSEADTRKLAEGLLTKPAVPAIPFVLGVAPEGWVVHLFVYQSRLVITPPGMTPQQAGIQIVFGDNGLHRNSFSRTVDGKVVTVDQMGVPQLNDADFRRFAEAITLRPGG